MTKRELFIFKKEFLIIPATMRIMVALMKLFGSFISIEKCGEIMAPLFTENQKDSLKKSGKFVTWKKKAFFELREDNLILNRELQDKLWDKSLELSADEKTNQLAKSLVAKGEF